MLGLFVTRAETNTKQMWNNAIGSQVSCQTLFIFLLLPKHKTIFPSFLFLVTIDKNVSMNWTLVQSNRNDS